MRIAVASGKGGTGKTTVSTNLAYVLSRIYKVQYIDCDVEEPNGHIFLKPRIDKITPITTSVPVIDDTKCTVCGECRNICQYNAIVALNKIMLTFPELCHGCGGCIRVCQSGAISEMHREVGEIEEGTADKLGFVQGKLRVGEVLSPLVIKRVKEYIQNDSVAIIDSPPGTSCPVVQSVKNSDYVVLVTEPTPFGLNDLKLAVDMLKALNLPFGVIVNRADAGNKAVFDYCSTESIDVLMKIPHDRRIAEAYSKGKLMVNVIPKFRTEFMNLFTGIEERTNESYRKR